MRSSRISAAPSSPALISRLSVQQSVAALGALCIVLLLALVATLVGRQWQEREAALAELDGMPQASALLRLARQSAEHRGMSAGFLGGNDDFRAKLEAKRGEVGKTLEQVLAQSAELARRSPRVRELRDALGQEWPALSAAVAARSLPGGESFRRHNALVERELQLLDELLYAAGLALDAEPLAHHLILATLQHQPRLNESIGQMRGFGAGMLAKPDFAAGDRAFIARTLEDSRRSFAAGSLALERAGAFDAQLRQRLQTPLREAQAGFEQAVALIDAQLLKAEAPAMKGAEFFAAVTRAIDAQFAVAGVSLELLEQQMQARAEQRLHAVLASAVLGGFMLLLVPAAVLALLRSVRRKARAAIATAEAMARGDFSVATALAGGDEFGAIAAALERARLDMSHAIGEVRHGVEAVAVASREISQGSHDLSRRTEMQASSLQETAASMEQLASVVSQSTDHALQAQQLAGSASSDASEGGEVMGRVVATMGEISAASQRIAGIVGLIDSIAFQTNILALNAAVEAARAGEQGRGFAVVASEVRSLAQRSAEAAREIKTMIGASVERIDSGSQLVEEAGRSMARIVGQVHGVTAILTKISAGAQEHSTGIEQISTAVVHLDEATQQNSALSEQSAAAAQSLHEQSERLAQAVAAFRLAQA